MWIDYLNGIATPESEWLDRETARRRLGLLDLMESDSHWQVADVLKIQHVVIDDAFNEVKGTPIQSPAGFGLREPKAK